MLLLSQYFTHKHTHTTLSMNLHFFPSLNSSWILGIFFASSAIANYYFTYCQCRGDTSSSKSCAHCDEGLISLLLLGSGISGQDLGYLYKLLIPEDEAMHDLTQEELLIMLLSW